MFGKVFRRITGREDNSDRDQVFSEICRLAIGDLGHPDSMLLALYCVCAITGYVMQQVKLGERIANGVAHNAPDVVSVVTSTGRTYVFGDVITATLMRNGTHAGILPCLAGQVRLSLKDSDVGAWLSHSAATVGTEEFGKPASPFDNWDWPSVDHAIANTGGIVNYLKTNGLVPSQFGAVLINVARFVISRAVKENPGYEPKQIVRLGSEAALSGSHILPVSK